MNIFFGVEDTSEKYSHLNIGGKTYTLTYIIWLNDIYNHPEYKKLVTEYTRFEQFKYDELNRIEDEFDRSFEIYLTTYANQIKAITEIDQVNRRNNNITRGGYGIYNTIQNSYNPTAELKLLKDNVGKDDYNSLKIVAKALSILINNPNIRAIPRIDTFKDATSKLLINAEIMEYLSNPTTMIDTNSKENQERLSRLRSWPGYNDIQKFIGLANQLKIQNSSNILLQRQLESYILKTGGDSDDFIKAMNPKNSRDLLHIIDTGISLTQPAKIYLRVDVIGGKVDDSNKSQIACIFSGENLGNDFEELTKVKNFWELDKNRFYFDMDSETSTIINELKETVKTTSTKSPDTPSSTAKTEKTEKARPKKGGKKRRTYRIRK